MTNDMKDPRFCWACEGTGLQLGFRDVATARGDHDTCDSADDCDRCDGTGRVVDLDDASAWPVFVIGGAA